MKEQRFRAHLPFALGPLKLSLAQINLPFSCSTVQMRKWWRTMNSHVTSSASCSFSVRATITVSQWRRELSLFRTSGCFRVTEELMKFLMLNSYVSPICCTWNTQTYAVHFSSTHIWTIIRIYSIWYIENYVWNASCLCFLCSDFQNYLRTQTGSTTTINIIICTVDYLLRLQVPLIHRHSDSDIGPNVSFLNVSILQK